MGTAQISFASFAAQSERGLLAWRRFASAARAAHGVPETVADPAASAYWRLHAPNYRELARSARLYSSMTAAYAEAVGIAGRADECTVHTFVAEAVRSVGWYIALDGQPVILCARWYQSLVIAAQAGTRSLRALQEAVTPPVLVPVPPVKAEP